MKEKKKQSTVIVVATILTVTSVISPVASVYANETDTAISQQTETVQIKENAPPITLPQKLIGNEGQALQDIVLPENWKWSDETTVISKDRTEYPAKIMVDDTAYDYSAIDGYNAAGHFVENNLTIVVKEQEMAIESTESETKVSSFVIDVDKNRLSIPRAGDIAINDTNFPDEAFRTWLEQQDYGQDRIITQDEIASITMLDVRKNKDIKDLTGIGYFTALTILNCSETGIKDLDVSKNIALVNLYCSVTGITELNIDNNLNLAYLSCYNTKINDLDVSKNTKLTHLYCYDTGIKDLNVSNNTALTDLYCSNTKIINLDVSKNTALIYLSCYDTGITDLNLSDNTALTDLYCYNTDIKDLDISKNTDLIYLYCYNTEIKNLDVSKNAKLTNLRCYNTGISSLDVSNNTKLTFLHCSRTPLAYINIGTNSNLTTIFKSSLKPVDLKIKGDCFNILDKFTGIDKDKITNVKNANYDSSTGIVSNYNVGIPITYTYNCGTSSSGTVQMIDVILNLTDTRANSTIVVSANLDKPYDGTAVSTYPSITKTGSTSEVSYKWEKKVNDTDWEEITSAPTDAGTYRVTAILASDSNYKGATSEPKEFTISKANSTIFITDKLNKTYDKTTVNAMPNVSTTGSCGPVRYYWKKKVNGIWESIASAPTDAGTYRVTASLASDSNYKGATNTKDFVISQATNSWIDNLVITDWAYGGKASNPTARANFGDITFTYSNSEKGIYTVKVPTTAGTWYVKATVAATDNYTGLETTLAFTITPKSVDNNSQIVISDINSDKDVENLVIKDNDKELVKGTDYEVEKKQDGNKVEVIITFKGNYTGVITKTYTIKDEIKDSESIPTGDNTNTGLLSMMILLSAGCIAFLKKDKKSMK